MPKILIVDDSELITRVLSFLVVDELGFEAVVAGSYQETEACLKQHQGEITAAVVDLSLPDAPHGEAVDLVLQYQIPTIVLSATWRALVRSRLELFNLPVIEAEDGAEAYQLLQDNPDIQLLVSDYEMPHMDGFELVKKMRKTRSYEDLVIIGLSASQLETVSAKFVKSGANDFLHKPFSFEELQCRIMQNLETMDHIREIRRAANQDYLTGLNNRRYFFETGEQHFKTADSNGQSRVAAIMDLDFFKQVNDNYGHDVGDAVLVHLAGLIKQLPSDVLTARLGGEEFGMLSVNKSLNQVHALVQKFVEKVAAMPVICGGQSLNISLSIGITAQGDSLDEMLKIADQGLYRAKENGRNRVELG